ncbi:MAG TPA: glycosyltransferase [Candidatus Gastranaerophilales bacterium]|nr:glycosyltransferase [Candidatus Gastranaerophilales bacterium]
MKWKADLHVHSKYSDKPTNWLLKQFGCSECFSEPEEIYQAAKKQGMTCVTITDHNDIRGCLEILKYPDAFISCEISTLFPENDCKLHILTYNISEHQYYEMMKLRYNVYDLREYIIENKILYSLAHPIYSVNDKLTPEVFEKMLVLFNTFEINGCRSIEQNNILKIILNNLTPEIINELAAKYNIKPAGEAWRKTFTAGSDDHTGLKIAAKYSESEKASNIKNFLENIIIEGKFEEKGFNLNPKGLAHNLYSIAYQFYSERLDLEKFVTKDISLKIIDQLLLNKEREEDLISKLILNFRNTTFKALNNDQELLSNSLINIINKTMITKHSDIIKDITPENIAEKWFVVANSNINAGLSHLINYLLNTIKKGNVFDIFHTLGSVGSLYFLIAPYFIAYSMFERDKNFAFKLKEKFGGDKQDVKVAHFSDTFYDVNGVAKTLQQNLKTAKKINKDYTIITCINSDENVQKVLDEKVFEPIGKSEIPEYSELNFYYPPFLEMLDYCYNQNFTHIHCATPGPIGLAALSISKILKKPIYGTYHTAFPQYMSYLTGDSTMEKIAWKYMIWFYNQLDIIFVPSKIMIEELASKGIDSRKLKLYPRGIDIDRFRPIVAKNPETIKLLYVGRISQEKNLHLLAKAFKKLSAERNDVVLQIVGDGPYREEMFNYLKDSNVIFTGYKQGDELVRLYSEADLFVFPSTTDTFGNVVLEAQACATPVLVTDSGGPMENIIPEETGIIVQGNSDEAIYKGIKTLLDKDRLGRMSEKAFEYMKNRSFEEAFLQTWKFYENDSLKDFEAKPGLNLSQDSVLQKL